MVGLNLVTLPIFLHSLELIIYITEANDSWNSMHFHTSNSCF